MFTNYCALFPLQNKHFRPWEVCSLDELWSFAASHSLKHFINRCTWKSSQYYIVISRMTSFIRISQKLVFHQSKCFCAIKRILSTTAMYVSSSSLRYSIQYMHYQTTCRLDATPRTTVSKTDFSGREENTTGRVVVTWRHIARCVRHSSGHVFDA